MLKKQIPNFITLLNLLSGSVAVILALQNQLLMATIFVGLGIFFDFFDGLAARSLKVQSELGLQLDSLADMVTSGLVPGIVMFQLLCQSLGADVLSPTSWGQSNFEINFPLIALFGLLITLGSAYRLAKFNIDDRQTSSFIGLPTPANAILILSLPLILYFHESEMALKIILNPYFLIGLSVLSCILLNAEIALFALKFKNLSFKSNWYRFLFLSVSIIGLLVFQFLALPFIIIGYIVLSLLLNLNEKGVNYSNILFFLNSKFCPK